MDISLVMFKSDGTRRDFPLTQHRTVIGRKRSCDLRIPLTSVSRQHCEIVIEDDTATIRDLGSSNGTYHNSTRVQEQKLSAGTKWWSDRSCSSSPSTACPRRSARYAPSSTPPARPGRVLQRPSGSEVSSPPEPTTIETQASPSPKKRKTSSSKSSRRPPSTSTTRSPPSKPWPVTIPIRQRAIAAVAFGPGRDRWVRRRLRHRAPRHRRRGHGRRQGGLILPPTRRHVPGEDFHAIHCRSRRFEQRVVSVATRAFATRPVIRSAQLACVV